MKKTAFAATLLLLVLAGLIGFTMNSSTTPKYTGSFKWTHVVIGEDARAGGTRYEVFESIEKMTKIFTLQPGDECFYLRGKEWEWHDGKDPAFSLIPILCPNKGGGWGMPP
jgi:hypothetical protein